MSDLRYSVGTASIAADGTVVTLSGAILSSVNIRPWDAIQLDPANNNILIPIIAVDQTNLQLTVPEWNGGAKTNVSYVVYQISPERYVGGRSMADVDAMLAALNTEGWYRYINPAYSDPTAAGLVANEGQFAFKYTTGQLWEMSGGVWQFVGIFKGFSAKGSWNNATAYVANDVVSYNGSSYISLQGGTNHLPTDTAWWMLLAAKGDLGPAALKPIAAWVTATAYSPGPPADYVTIGGSSYACVVAHTSAASFATDLAAGRWLVVGAKGADAPTFGGTSTTPLTLGVGTKAFVTQTTLAYQNGARIRATSNADPSKWMEGPVTYTNGSSALTMSADKFSGTGTVNDWNFNPAGQPGAGDLSSANNLGDLNNSLTALTNLGLDTRAIRTDISQSGLTAAQLRQSQVNIGFPALMRGHLAGLMFTVAGGSGSFTVSGGVAVNSTNTDIMVLPSAITKTTASNWTVGSGVGGLDNGAMAANTTYHVHLIKRPDTGVVDVLFSLSATTPTLPANYTMFRRIGSLRVDGVQQFIKLAHYNDTFLLDIPTQDVNFNGTTAVQTATLKVPSGISVDALIHAGGIAPGTGAAGQGRAWVFSPLQNSPNSTSIGAQIFNVGIFTSALGSQNWGELEIRTGLSSDIKFSIEIASMTLQIYTKGWKDTRGRFA